MMTPPPHKKQNIHFIQVFYLFTDKALSTIIKGESGVIVSKIDKLVTVSEFDSHYVPLLALCQTK